MHNTTNADIFIVLFKNTTFNRTSRFFLFYSNGTTIILLSLLSLGLEQVGSFDNDTINSWVNPMLLDILDLNQTYNFPPATLQCVKSMMVKVTFLLVKRYSSRTGSIILKSWCAENNTWSSLHIYGHSFVITKRNHRPKHFSLLIDVWFFLI